MMHQYYEIGLQGSDEDGWTAWEWAGTEEEEGETRAEALRNLAEAIEDE